jgi:hypothetical protein
MVLPVIAPRSQLLKDTLARRDFAMDAAINDPGTNQWKTRRAEHLCFAPTVCDWCDAEQTIG